MERNITTAQTVFRSSVVWVGILLNCVVLIAVSFSRQLHNPRHIFWAAVSIWECVLLFDCGIELVAVGRSSQSQLFCLSVCRFFISQWLFSFTYLPGVGRLWSLHFHFCCLTPSLKNRDFCKKKRTLLFHFWVKWWFYDMSLEIPSRESLKRLDSHHILKLIDSVHGNKNSKIEKTGKKIIYALVP